MNCGSPNTPNLRDLQNVDKLKSILIPILVENKSRSNKPILLKIAPDLTNTQLDDIVDIIAETRLDGVVATNTTINRDNLKTDKLTVDKIGNGGLSGRPLQLRSNEIIRMIKKFSNGTLPIIGVGGIDSGKSAYDKFLAGASFLQLYTGMVYQGPNIVSKIKKELKQILIDKKVKNFKEIIGKKDY